jgi:hypothetical protein
MARSLSLPPRICLSTSKRATTFLHLFISGIICCQWQRRGPPSCAERACRQCSRAAHEQAKHRHPTIAYSPYAHRTVRDALHTVDVSHGWRGPDTLITCFRVQHWIHTTDYPFGLPRVIITACGTSPNAGSVLIIGFNSCELSSFRPSTAQTLFIVVRDFMPLSPSSLLPRNVRRLGMLVARIMQFHDDRWNTSRSKSMQRTKRYQICFYYSLPILQYLVEPLFVTLLR